MSKELIAVVNRNSLNGHRAPVAEGAFAELGTRGWNVDKIDVSKLGNSVKDELQRKVLAGSALYDDILVAIVGGDGTLKHVLDTVNEVRPESTRNTLDKKGKVRFLFIPTGFINVGRILGYGSAIAKDQIMTTAEENCDLLVYPQRVRMTQKGGEEIPHELMALLSTGIVGTPGFIRSYDVIRDLFRRPNKKLKELLVDFFKGIGDMKPQEISIKTDDGDVFKRKIIDIEVFKSKKWLWMDVPNTSSYTPEMTLMMITADSRVIGIGKLALAIAAMKSGLWPSELMETRSNIRSVTLSGDFNVHQDAEIIYDGGRKPIRMGQLEVDTTDHGVLFAAYPGEAIKRD